MPDTPAQGSKSRRKKGVSKLPPDLRLDGPTLSSDDVAERLGTTKQWILKLAKRDPAVHFNFLPGYVKNPEGAGWKRKTVEGRNREVYFYEDDVKRYEREHPVGEEMDFSKIVVPPELEKLIKEIAADEIEKIGFVRITAIRDRLIAEYGYSDRVYRQVRKIAQEEIENWPMDSRGEKNVGPKRRGGKIPASTKSA